MRVLSIHLLKLVFLIIVDGVTMILGEVCSESAFAQQKGFVTNPTTKTKHVNYFKHLMKTPYRMQLTETGLQSNLKKSPILTKIFLLESHSKRLTSFTYEILYQ